MIASHDDNVRLIEKPDTSDAELNNLFTASWPTHTPARVRSDAAT